MKSKDPPFQTELLSESPPMLDPGLLLVAALIGESNRYPL